MEKTTRKKKSENEFRVRIVELRDGSKLYYPEHRIKGIWASWITIVLVNNKIYKTDPNINANDPDYGLSDEKSAEEYCTAYKDKLLLESGKLFAAETIKELTLV